MDCVPPGDYRHFDQVAEVREYKPPQHPQRPEMPESFFRLPPPPVDTPLPPDTGDLNLAGQVSKLRVG